MDHQNQDSAHDLNIKNTSEQNSNRLEIFSCNSIITNVDDSKDIRDEDVPKEISAFRQEVDSIKNSSNNDEITNFKDAVHDEFVIFKNTSEGNPANTKEEKQHRGINATLKEVLVFNMDFRKMLTGTAIPKKEQFHYTPGENGFLMKAFVTAFFMLTITSSAISTLVFYPEIIVIIQSEKLYGQILGFGSLFLVACIVFAMLCLRCCHGMPFVIVMIILTVIAYSLLGLMMSIWMRSLVLSYSFGVTGFIALICVLLSCTRFNFKGFLLDIIVVIVVIGIFGTLFVVVQSIDLDIKELTGNSFFVTAIASLLQSFEQTPSNCRKNICSHKLSGASNNRVHQSVSAILNIILSLELQIIIDHKAVEISKKESFYMGYMLYSSFIDVLFRVIQLLCKRRRRRRRF